VPAIALANRSRTGPGDLNHVFLPDQGPKANELQNIFAWSRNLLGHEGKARGKSTLSAVRMLHGSSIGSVFAWRMSYMPPQGACLSPAFTTIQPADWWGRGRGPYTRGIRACALRKSLKPKSRTRRPTRSPPFIGEPIQGCRRRIFRQAILGLKSSGFVTKYNVLIIADEVFVGFGPAPANWFGSQTHWGFKAAYHGRSPRALALGHQPIGGSHCL